jgi:hypothetical protein
MAIQNVPAFPLRSQGLAQQAYSAGVEASLSALPKFIDDMNAVGSAYALTTNGTSTTSVAIGTGSKSFTTQTNLGYLVGMTLRLAFDSVNYMTGDVTSYNTGSGALVVNVTSVVGSGTRTSWVITMAAVGASAAGSVSFTPAGNIAATNVQAAIQELDTEKLSNSAGAVTGTNLESIITGATVGSSANIPVVTHDAKGRVTGTSTAQKITIGTSVATTSGTSIDFTSIPSTVKRITVLITGLSTNGSSIPMIQIGDSGGIENTGYSGAACQGSSGGNTVSAGSTGFLISGGGGASQIFNGIYTLCLINPATNLWGASFTGSNTDAARFLIANGTKALSENLDRVRLTTVNGTDTFDAGSINIWWE